MDGGAAVVVAGERRRAVLDFGLEVFLVDGSGLQHRRQDCFTRQHMGRQIFGFGGALVDVFAEGLELSRDDLEAFLQGVDLLEKARILQHFEKHLMGVACGRFLLI